MNRPEPASFPVFPVPTLKRPQLLIRQAVVNAEKPDLDASMSKPLSQWISLASNNFPQPKNKRNKTIMIQVLAQQQQQTFCLPSQQDRKDNPGA